MRRLIIGADDFGSCLEVNRAVERAFRDGVLTSCSLMASGDAFRDAVEIAKRNPALGVGVHLVVCGGKSVLSHRAIPRLVDGHERFRSNPVFAGIAYAVLPGIRREIEAELRAQIERVMATGILVSHLDCHMHLHVHPVVLGALLKLGTEYHIKRIRVPYEPVSMGCPEGFSCRELRVLALRMKPVLESNGYHFNDYIYGVRRSGNMREDYVLRLLDDLPVGVGEIYFHPADPPKGSLPMEAKGPNAGDFGTLMSSRIREKMAEVGVTRTSYLGLEIIA